MNERAGEDVRTSQMTETCIYNAEFFLALIGEEVPLSSVLPDKEWEQEMITDLELFF